MLQVQMLSPNSIEDQTKKGLLRKLKGLKRKSSPQFDTIFCRNLEFIRADC